MMFDMTCCAIVCGCSIAKWYPSRYPSCATFQFEVGEFVLFVHVPVLEVRKTRVPEACHRGSRPDRWLRQARETRRSFLHARPTGAR